MMQRRKINGLLSAALYAAALPIEAQTSPTTTNLPSGNTRLLATEQDWSLLKKRIAQEPDLAAYHTSLLEVAQLQLALPLVEYKKIGRRLLNVSRSLLQRVMLLGYAWQMTGQTRYAENAVANLLAAADFSDWNPSHFLDVGEAVAAMAVGVDWLHAAVTLDQREVILRSLVEKGLRPGLDPAARTNWWHRAQNNWNQVCFGGLTLGALAVLAYPSLKSPGQGVKEANELLASARTGIAHGLKPYAPDGIYPEGPAYWGYGTSYQVLMMAALYSAQGNAWQMENAPGFMASAAAYVQQHGAQGTPFNFADGNDRQRFEPALFWMARELKQSSLLKFEMMQLGSAAARRVAIRSQRIAPLAALWWPTTSSAEHNPLPLNWNGQGECALAVFRESWNDARGFYVAIKAGSASLNHAHMDAGSFVFERDGVRWGVDLGLQDYESLESKGIDLWSKKQESERWKVFRLNNFSHSALTLNGQLHRVDGHAHFNVVNLAQRYVQLNLSEVFKGQATRVQRSLRVQGRSVILIDELEGLAPNANVRWQMPTRAAIALQGGQALLTQDGQQLTLSVRTSGTTQPVQWSSESVERPLPDFNAPNPGVRMLIADVRSDSGGHLKLEVTLGV